MWFLLIQIFFFMCVSAVLGAALAWWWLRRRFIDVTETHAELTKQVKTAIAEGRALKREDLDASVSTALGAYQPPQPDFQPLHDRLQKLEEGISAPDPLINTFGERIGTIEQSVATISASIASLRSIHFEALGQGVRDVAARVDAIQMPDMDSVNERVIALTESVSANRPDLAPVEERLASLESLMTNFRIPEVDLGPVHSGLARIDLSLSELQPPEVDLRPVEARLSRLEELLEQIDAKQAAATVSEEITAVSGDVSAVAGTVTTLVAEIAALSQEVANVSSGIAAVTAEVTGITGEVDAVASDVASVGQAVARISIPDAPDLDPVHNRLAEIDASLMDRFAALQDRITATTPLNDALIATLAAIESDLEVVASRRGPDLEPLFVQLASLDSSVGTIRNELRSQTRLEVLERRLISIQEAVQNAPSGEVTREDLTALEDRLTAIEYGVTALHHALRSRGDYMRGADHEPPRPRAEAASYEARAPQRTTRAIPAAEMQAITARRAEAIAAARRPDDRANLLTHAAFGEGDDLAQIVGVGPILTELLHEVGVYYFWQIAEWTDEDVAYVDEKLLHFKGRIERDDWVGQSKALAAMPGAAPRPEAH